MAQQTIDLGTVANDGTGDDLRTGGGKINANFTELYAMAAAAGGRWKDPVRAATTANGTLASAFENGDTIDGVTLATGDRILLKNQSTASENGIYVVNASGAPTRATDADAGAELVNAAVLVSEGTANADKLFVCTTNAPITVGSTGLTFTNPFSAGDTNIVDGAWFNVKASPYNATGDGSTDDTAAIQAAIDACEAAGGGTVYFPRGTYVVNGALQDTSRSNAQIVLPKRDYGDTEAITIVLRGEAPPSAVASVTGATPIQNNLSIIKGTLNTTGGTAPCMMGSHGPVGTSANFTNILLVMRDLTVEMPSNPVLTALDFSCVAQIDLDNVQVHTGSFDVAGLSMQTTSTSYGIRTPGLNNGALTRLNNINVIGFYNAFEVGEHTIGQNVTAWGCKRAYVFVAAYHASMFTRLQIVHCQNGLVGTGGLHPVRIAQYNIEHAASGTWVPTYDVDDSSNYLGGEVSWNTVLAGTGRSQILLVNGAKYLKRIQLTAAAGIYALTDGATVTVDCSVAENFRWTIGGNRTFANPSNPYAGQVINVRIIQDGTGSRVITWGSKFKFAGGAPVLSTAASAKDFLSAQYDETDDTWNCALMKAMA